MRRMTAGSTGGARPESGLQYLVPDGQGIPQGMGIPQGILVPPGPPPMYSLQHAQIHQPAFVDAALLHALQEEMRLRDQQHAEALAAKDARIRDEEATKTKLFRLCKEQRERLAAVEGGTDTKLSTSGTAVDMTNVVSLSEFNKVSEALAKAIQELKQAKTDLQLSKMKQDSTFTEYMTLASQLKNAQEEIAKEKALHQNTTKLLTQKTNQIESHEKKLENEAAKDAKLSDKYLKDIQKLNKRENERKERETKLKEENASMKLDLKITKAELNKIKKEKTPKVDQLLVVQAELKCCQVKLHEKEEESKFLQRRVHELRAEVVDKEKENQKLKTEARLLACELQKEKTIHAQLRGNLLSLAADGGNAVPASMNTSHVDAASFSSSIDHGLAPHAHVVPSRPSRVTVPKTQPVKSKPKRAEQKVDVVAVGATPESKKRKRYSERSNPSPGILSTANSSQALLTVSVRESSGEVPKTKRIDCKRRILSIYTFFEEKPPALGFDALCPETKTISGHLTDILCDLEQYDVEDIIAGTIDAIHVMIDEDTRRLKHERAVLFLLWNLHKSKSRRRVSNDLSCSSPALPLLNIFSEVLASIIYNMSNQLEKAKLDDIISFTFTTLTRIFVSTCSYMGSYCPVRVLAFDLAIVKLSRQHTPQIMSPRSASGFEILMNAGEEVWPTVFNSEDDCISVVLRAIKGENQGTDESILLEYLFSALRDLSQHNDFDEREMEMRMFQLEKSFEIVAMFKGWKWSYDKLIPSLSEVMNEEDGESESFERMVPVIKVMGRVGNVARRLLSDDAEKNGHNEYETGLGYNEHLIDHILKITQRSECPEPVRNTGITAALLISQHSPTQFPHIYDKLAQLEASKEPSNFERDYNALLVPRI